VEDDKKGQSILTIILVVKVELVLMMLEYLEYASCDVLLRFIYTLTSESS
jgi:hypothetical protein